MNGRPNPGETDAAIDMDAAGSNPLGVRNLGEPIRLTEINVHGVLARAAQGGDVADVWTRMLLTSDQALFHKIVPNLAAVVEASARSVGGYVSLARATTTLLVMRPDNTGELWVDAAAVTNMSRLRRGNLKAGTVLFESDIADVTGFWFPLVEIGPRDRILCIFREGWRFALFFDFNSKGALDIEAAKRDLGTLYRSMRYADLYATLADQATFSRLLDGGWFPFLELVSDEFQALAAICEAGVDLADAEQQLVDKFDDARLERMFDRWMGRPHLKQREPILRSAMNAFKAKNRYRPSRPF